MYSPHRFGARLLMINRDRNPELTSIQNQLQRCRAVGCNFSTGHRCNLSLEDGQSCNLSPPWLLKSVLYKALFADALGMHKLGLMSCAGSSHLKKSQCCMDGLEWEILRFAVATGIQF